MALAKIFVYLILSAASGAIAQGVGDTKASKALGGMQSVNQPTKQAAKEPTKSVTKPAIKQTMIVISPFNFEMRYERGNSQETEARNMNSFGISYVRPRYSMLFEAGSFSDETGNSTSSVKRDYQDYMLWGKWHLISNRDQLMRAIVYASVGAGAYKEKIKTVFMADTRVDESEMKGVGGAGLGVDFYMRGSAGWGFMAGAEGRALVAESFDPNPLIGLILRTGLIVSF